MKSALTVPRVSTALFDVRAVILETSLREWERHVPCRGGWGGHIHLPRSSSQLKRSRSPAEHLFSQRSEPLKAGLPPGAVKVIGGGPSWALISRTLQGPAQSTGQCSGTRGTPAAWLPPAHQGVSSPQGSRSLLGFPKGPDYFPAFRTVRGSTLPAATHAGRF